MKKIYTILCLLFLSITIQAKFSEVVLTDAQFKAIEQLKLSLDKSDTSIDKLSNIWKKDTTLTRIPFQEFKNIIMIVNPINKTAYKDSSRAYLQCYKVAKQLTEKILVDISSESADEKLAVSNELKFKRGDYFSMNLTQYLQNQFFDFFYNNKLLSVLENEEYVSLLIPKIVYKLLNDIKTPAVFTEEMLFIALNSKYKLF